MKTKKEIFCKAFIERDASFEGVFTVAVKTTGIFCRPTCPAKPKIENVEFFPTAKSALRNGYRACKVCKPLEEKSPSNISQLLNYMENNPSVEIKDTNIKKMGLDPKQVNKWTLKNYNLTFDTFQQIYRRDNVFQQLQSENKFDNISLKELNGKFKKVLGSHANMDNCKNIICITRIETELGTMIAGATDKGICMFEFADYKMLEMELRQLITLLKFPLVESDHVYFNTLREQIKKYFKGELREFSVPLDLAGTDFQVQAWLGLKNIPYGSTITYAKQAAALGKPSAVRAIANANGKNKISIILPCHRVIGTNGTLTGYGGGIWRKKKLLELEQNILKR